MAHWIKRFDSQLSLRRPVTDRQLADVPGKRGIFALLADRDAPIMLLTAANVRARLRGRLREPLEDKRRKTVDLRAVTRKVVWKLAGSHFETDLEFFEAARRMWAKTYTDLLAWRPAWFVGVNCRDNYPRFVRSRNLSASASQADASGRWFGPFSDGRSADHFITALQDTFDLCRDYRCLRQSPHAKRCAYGQMGRCLAACDGTISMAEYRRAVTEAADFAAGRREALRARLQSEMQAASAKLQFEQAGGIKARLKRLSEFDRPCYAHVAPLEEFCFILAQSSGRPDSLKVFLARGGAVTRWRALDYPLRPAQLDRALKRMAVHAARPVKAGQAELWRMGLIAHYLFCAQRRKGLILRWSSSLTAEQLAERIVQAKDDLKLRARKARKEPAGAKRASS